MKVLRRSEGSSSRPAALLLASLLLMSGPAGPSAEARTGQQQAALPSAAYLSGVGYVSQTYNNCGPASIIAAMGQFGMTTDQRALGALLRPAGGYMPVNVIGPFLRRIGLDTTYYKKGSPEQLMRLVSAGYPVIVLQWMDRVGGIPHYRVVRGYDRKSDIFWLSDSMYGANAYLKIRDFETLWKVYDNAFLPIYPSGDANRIRAILGA